MNDFEGLLTSDYGYKPRGKSAPISAPRPPSNTTSPLSFDLGPDSMFRSSGVQKPRNGSDFDDLFGDQTKRESEAVDFDSVFGTGLKPPVYDKPVYDDDIFEGVPGIKSFSSSSSGNKYGDVFESVSAPFTSSGQDGGSSAFDDILGGFGEANNLPKRKYSSNDEFDDLIPGFGGSSSASERLTPKPTWSSDPVATTRQTMEDPFADLASVSPHVNSSFAVPSDPLENFNNPNKSDERSKADEPSVSSGVYDDLDPFNDFPKPVSTSSSDTSSSRKDRGNLNGEEQVDQISPRDHGSHSNKPSVDNDLGTHQAFFDMPSASNSFSEPVDHSPLTPYETYSNKADVAVQEESIESSDDVWLSVSEIPLFTRPTSAPPPARPPPPRPTRGTKDCSGHGFEVPKSSHEDRSATLVELEASVMGKSTDYNVDTHANVFSSEAVGPNPDAEDSKSDIKEAMDRAEAKFRHGKVVRESDESWLDAEERALREKQEQLQKQREEEEKEHICREEEKEREQRRLEKERERERARQAVERATREARERAAAEARAKAERAAVAKANAEARERAERAAVLRAQAEARERAAAEARERAARAAAEAREREARERDTEARMKAERAEKEAAEAREKEAREKAAEARRRAERAAVERAAAEARQRAAAEARVRAAAATRANQQNSDIDSFFSAPWPKTTPTESSFDAQFSSKKGPEVARTSDAAASNVRKTSPSANFVDDFSSIFGVAPTTSGDFQEVKGETEERRRVRLDRHQRTQERAAKALAEKNQRDLQAQREQDERHRIGETLDIEIKRWSAGKVGNLRALLSTLQYVLWPECGWQPVSLTDLITSAAVKKAYRKATLCIHPDKVQQKGANLQQKYIAEKVFDLLKEAWNKFNSEELF